MIPAIGYMIGFYILTRGVEMILTDRTPGKRTLMILAAVGMMVITAGLMCLLFTTELSAMPNLGGLR